MSEAQMRACIDAYVAAWNEDDPVKRHALVEQACSPGLRFVTPGRAVGRDEFEAMIAGFRQRKPGARAIFTSSVDIQGKLFRYSGRAEDSTGASLGDALDVGECDEDGRISILLTFVD
jgi:hypothetical protein